MTCWLRIGPAAEPLVGSSRAVDDEASLSKARRRDLKILIPISYIWDRHVGFGLNRDRRRQEVITRLSNVSRAGQYLPEMTKD